MFKHLFLVAGLMIGSNSYASFGEVECAEEKEAVKAAEENCKTIDSKTDKKAAKACKKDVKSKKRSLKKCEKKLKADAKKLAKAKAKKVAAATKPADKDYCKKLGAVADAKNGCKKDPDCEDMSDAFTFVEISELEKNCFLRSPERKACEEKKKKWDEVTGKCN